MSDKESQVFRTNSHEEKGTNEGFDTEHNRGQENSIKSRKLNEHQQPGVEVTSKHIQVGFGKRVETEQSQEPLSAATVAATSAPKARAELEFAAKDATPWALSIHLEERIKALGASTASVNKLIDALDAGVNNLKKRTGL